MFIFHSFRGVETEVTRCSGLFVRDCIFSPTQCLSFHPRGLPPEVQPNPGPQERADCFLLKQGCCGDAVPKSLCRETLPQCEGIGDGPTDVIGS